MTEASMALPGVAWFFSVITDMNLYLCGELGGPIVPRGGGRHQIKTAGCLRRAEFGL
ncbi:hypothetical protein M5585_08685 [Serratia ureilytica]